MRDWRGARQARASSWGAPVQPARRSDCSIGQPSLNGNQPESDTGSMRIARMLRVESAASVAALTNCTSIRPGTRVGRAEPPQRSFRHARCHHSNRRVDSNVRGFANPCDVRVLHADGRLRVAIECKIQKVDETLWDVYKNVALALAPNPGSLFRSSSSQRSRASRPTAPGAIARVPRPAASLGSRQVLRATSAHPARQECRSGGDDRSRSLEATRPGYSPRAAPTAGPPVRTISCWLSNSLTEKAFRLAA
jgi:hypothetical protein